MTTIFSSFTVVSYGDLGVGIWLGSFGVWMLSCLSRPKEKREMRWGRGGGGAPCSTLSIITWGALLSGIGLSLLLKGLGYLTFDGRAFLFLVAGFAAILACGIRDSILQKKTPNQSLQPTAPSGRG